MEKTALLIIDLQNDYFAAGAFPLWQAEETKDRIVTFMHKAQAAGVEIIHVQHIADPALGLAPFFNQGTPGAEIHPDVLAAAPNAPIVVKTFADSFVKTTLEQVLSERSITRLWVAGMMTQNCVTHTAISRSAEKYDVAILPDLCTTVSEMLHLIALHAVSTRMALTPSATLLP
ncbi:cysteine hydrolase [Plesiomonas shigelloides]|uniref:cysteine hydrolase family protein n=1 Tax=Plesiomonas shigelloides TaxID=703 RepID=UPI000D57DBE7|nr:isochorismatase family protein [Plesiomonas shigelloides]PVU65073.1 cysteine hydrolase [Plesiomonas shigelloides]